MTARTDRRIALIAGTILAAVFTLCSATQVASWTIGSVKRSSHKVIEGPVGTLTVDARSGDIVLVPSDSDSVVIDSEASGTLHTPELEVRPEGARVRVAGGCPQFTFGKCSSEIVVRVPARTAVKVAAGSGDISADGLDGNVTLHSASGDVVGNDLDGASVELTSNSGDIVAAGVRAASIVTRTGSGDVTVHALRVPASLEARSDSGDIAVLVPPGDELYRVDAETKSGDRSVGVATTSRATNSVTARTNSGDVVVDYGS